MEWTPNIQHSKTNHNKSDHSHLSPLIGRTIDHVEGKPIAVNDDEDGYFHEKSAEVPGNHLILCGNLSKRYVFLFSFSFINK